MRSEMCTVPEVGGTKLPSGPLGKGEQVPKSLEQHVHSGERAAV